jgi:hypothetical protein
VAIDRLLIASDDVNRSFGFFLGMAALAASGGDAEPLFRLTGQPGFYDRWLAFGGAGSVTTALAIDHAGATMAGKAPRVTETEALYRSVCVTYPSQDRAPACAAIEAMRRVETPLADRKAIAERTMQALAAQTGAASP